MQKIILLAFVTIAYASHAMNTKEEDYTLLSLLLQHNDLSKKIFACCDIPTKDSLIKINKQFSLYTPNNLTVLIENPLIISNKKASLLLQDNIHKKPNFLVINNLTTIKPHLKHPALRSLIRHNTNISNAIFAQLLERSPLKTINNKQNGKTLLSLAVMYNNIAATHVLIHHENCNVNTAITKSRTTPLSHACLGGYQKIATLLLHHKNINPYLCDGHNNSILHDATSKGYTNIVRLLIQSGTIQNLVNQTNTDNLVPLYSAACFGYYNIAKLLCDHGANPNIKYKEMYSPLFVACENRHFNIVKILLQLENIKINETDSNLQSPLHAAAQNGYDDIVELLLLHPDINVKSLYNGYDALAIATAEGHYKVMTLLLAHSPYLIDTRAQGESLLHLSVIAHSHEAIHLLLSKNINVNALNAHGKTPLDIAQEIGAGPLLIHLLLAKGATNNFYQ